jgi:regulator of replication initiation timing
LIEEINKLNKDNYQLKLHVSNQAEQNKAFVDENQHLKRLYNEKVEEMKNERNLHISRFNESD